MTAVSQISPSNCSDFTPSVQSELSELINGFPIKTAAHYGTDDDDDDADRSKLEHQTAAAGGDNTRC